MRLSYFDIVSSWDMVQKIEIQLKHKKSSCAVSTRKNTAKGYTVAYPTAGASQDVRSLE